MKVDFKKKSDLIATRIKITILISLKAQFVILLEAAKYRTFT